MFSLCWIDCALLVKLADHCYRTRTQVKIIPFSTDAGWISHKSSNPKYYLLSISVKPFGHPVTTVHFSSKYFGFPSSHKTKHSRLPSPCFNAQMKFSTWLPRATEIISTWTFPVYTSMEPEVEREESFLLHCGYLFPYSEF